MATAPEQEKPQPGRPGGPDRLGPVNAPRGRLWGLIGIALVLVGAGAIIFSGSYDEPVEAKAVGRNIPVNPGAQQPLDLSAHNSPSVARNPRDQANIVVTSRIDAPRYSCALNVSFDGGSSFTQSAIPAPRGEEPKCYAPDVAFGADGTLYLSYATLKGRANVPNAVWIVRSTDGGRTLTNPNKVLGKLAFQARLTTDPSQRGRLYLTYLQASDVGLYKFTEPGNPIRAIRSDDGGSNWSDPTRVNDAARRRAIAPNSAIGPKGEVYVLYLDLGDDSLDYEGAHRGRGGPPFDGRWKLVLARSTDKGATWSEAPIKDEIVPTERFIAFTPPFPSIAVAKDGRVYAAFQDGRLGDADVRLWSLPSGASDWSDSTRVNDTPERDKTAQYLPEVSVAPNERVDVVYYDRRADKQNVMNETSFQYSTDNGKKFAKRLRLSDRPFSSRIGFGSERGLPDLGSRLGELSTDRRALAVWTDTRAGTRRTGKQDLAERVVAFSDPPRLSSGVKNLLRIGGIVLGLVGLVLLGMWLLGQRGATLSPARP